MFLECFHNEQQDSNSIHDVYCDSDGLWLFCWLGQVRLSEYLSVDDAPYDDEEQWQVDNR